MDQIQATKRQLSIPILSRALALGVMFAASSAAANDQLLPLYGNTLITTDDGIVSHFWYKSDHTFTGTVPAYSYPLKGSWTENGDGTICRNFDPPLPKVKNPDCGAILVRKVGDKQTDAQGHSEMLAAGVQ